ncbi:hypothetical protein A8C75_15080 [Marinobacterium aestuarii]|uniref:Uncharacterized protein n=1 Tax=Marinobacterium aestuarii TaxID=1821621 RepID=A0A1A9F1A4_9GAMM|nr:hypothetical protein [Marinobacterium aestuarii]ANG63671.1 hypothetical protein A8C75_15080 [Marinobacterium aestuarii]
MKKSVLLLCGIIVAAATLGAANEALKPGPVQPVDIESRIPASPLPDQPAESLSAPSYLGDAPFRLGDDTAHILLPPPGTFPIDERGEASPIPHNLA